MNITRVRDAVEIDSNIRWFDECSLSTLILYTTINGAIAVLATWLTLKVLFRYNNCRW